MHFEKEMAERLKPLIQLELDRRKNIKVDLIEKIVIGCANIYGFTDLAYILKYLHKIKRKLGIELNEADFLKILFPMYCQAFKNNDILPYLFPFANLLGSIPMRSI